MNNGIMYRHILIFISPHPITFSKNSVKPLRNLTNILISIIIEIKLLYSPYHLFYLLKVDVALKPQIV